jgi:hypothetical protein
MLSCNGKDSAHELLKLRIKDEVFKISPDKKQYAEVLLNGKSGFRHVPMIVSMYRAF